MGEDSCNNQDVSYVGMKPPEVAEELGAGVDDFLSSLYGDV